MLNKNQRTIIILMIAAIIGMFAYPPYHLIARDGIVINQGYGWIFSPKGFATVDVAMLLIQIAGVVIVGCLAMYLTKIDPENSQSGPERARLEIEAAQERNQSEESQNEASGPNRAASETPSNLHVQEPTPWAYLLHFLAIALSLPLVKAAGLGGAIPVFLGGSLALWSSRIIVSRVYALIISSPIRTAVLCLLPLAYFLIYLFFYYVLASNKPA